MQIWRMGEAEWQCNPRHPLKGPAMSASLARRGRRARQCPPAYPARARQARRHTACTNGQWRKPTVVQHIPAPPRAKARPESNGACLPTAYTRKRLHALAPGCGNPLASPLGVVMSRQARRLPAMGIHAPS